MKLVKAEEMKTIDRRASQEYMIPSLLLMENAGLRVVESIRAILPEGNRTRVIILAGKGNNGGDGLVVGRHLANSGTSIDLFLLGDADALTPDARVNYDILHKMGIPIQPLTLEKHLPGLMTALLQADLVVDAIYGIGFRGRLNDFETKVADLLNRSRVPVLAVDIASGVEADTGKVHGSAVKANYTVTLALPKLGLITSPGSEYTGQLSVADISIPRSLLEDPALKMNLIDATAIKGWLTPRAADTHKGTYGHVLVVGGSVGMTGAVTMTSCAALRCGAGLVTAALPEPQMPILDAAAMEVMSRALPVTSLGGISIDALPVLESLLGTCSVCAVGPGMSRYQEANAILRFILENAGVPVLIDADGINALASDPDVLSDRQVPVVITPHPRELARLTGLTVEEIQHNRIEVASRYAVNWGITIVLKGHQTVVACPHGDVHINSSGNPGMATAGSGDVLSGIITGLIAQGLKTQQAAVAGVYIHGRAGDQAAADVGQRGMIAGDIIDYLPYTLLEIAGQ